jgi:flagellar basal body rod protein FlgG
MPGGYHAFVDGIATDNLANVSTDGFRRIAAHGTLTPTGVSISGSRGPAAAPGMPNGVDAIAEMVDVLAAERSFESAQKAVAAIDQARQKSAEAARIQ